MKKILKSLNSKKLLKILFQNISLKRKFTTSRFMFENKETTDVKEEKALKENKDGTNKLIQQKNVELKDKSLPSGIIIKEYEKEGIKEEILKEKQNEEKLAEVWKEDSLLKDIIKEECKNNNLPKEAETEFIQITFKNGLYILKQWKSLTEEEKNNDGYPRGLRKILDEVSGIKKENKLDLNEKEAILEFFFFKQTSRIKKKKNYFRHLEKISLLLKELKLQKKFIK